MAPWGPRVVSLLSPEFLCSSREIASANQPCVCPHSVASHCEVYGLICRSAYAFPIVTDFMGTVLNTLKK